jgi:hypothetical protein
VFERESMTEFVQGWLLALSVLTIPDYTSLFFRLSITVGKEVLTSQREANHTARGREMKAQRKKKAFLTRRPNPWNLSDVP